MPFNIPNLCLFFFPARGGLFSCVFLYLACGLPKKTPEKTTRLENHPKSQIPPPKNHQNKSKPPDQKTTRITKIFKKPPEWFWWFWWKTTRINNPGLQPGAGTLERTVPRVCVGSATGAETAPRITREWRWNGPQPVSADTKWKIEKSRFYRLNTAPSPDLCSPACP